MNRGKDEFARALVISKLEWEIFKWEAVKMHCFYDETVEKFDDEIAKLKSQIEELKRPPSSEAKEKMGE